MEACSRQQPTNSKVDSRFSERCQPEFMLPDPSNLWFLSSLKPCASHPREQHKEQHWGQRGKDKGQSTRQEKGQDTTRQTRTGQDRNTDRTGRGTRDKGQAERKASCQAKTRQDTLEIPKPYGENARNKSRKVRLAMVNYQLDCGRKI